MTAFIEVHNLQKQYQRHQVLQGIDFAIQKGEFFALLGPNGAGKSTTISILCGLTQADEGQVMFGGKAMDQKGLRDHIGVVFQHHCLDEILSGYDNLMLRCGFYKLTKKASRKRVRELSEICELTAFLHQRVATLSGGQKRRLDIARALISAPELLILDEPTTGLDPISRSHIWEMIQALREDHGMSILLTTHYLEEASSADTICILHRGKVALYGDLSSISKVQVHDYLYLYSSQLEPMARILKQRHIPFTYQDDKLQVLITSTRQTLSILQSCALSLERFEVRQGSLADVYVSILEGVKV